MKCCGKCYLKKQLNKTEDGNSKRGPIQNKNSETVVYIIEKIFSVPAAFNNSDINFNVASNSNYYYNFHSSIFHPPALT